MIPIIKWTVWQRRWSTLWWCFGVFAFLFVNLIFYPSFKDQSAELQKSFQNIPDAAAQLIGGTDFFSPVGYLDSQVFFIMMPLILGILAIALGSSLIGREEQDTTIETLLARPLSRSKLLLAKVLAGLAVLGIVAGVGLITVAIMAKAVDIAVPLTNIIWATLACIVLTISFGAVAFLLTTIGRARGGSLGIASAIAIGGYIISSLAGTVDWLKGPSKIFPFHYYDSEAILRGHFNWAHMAFLFAVIAACGLIGWISFRRRDIA